MRTLAIEGVRATRREGISELSATAHWSRYGTRGVYFRTTHPLVATSIEPFVAAALLPAMYHKLDLKLDAPVAADVLRAARRIRGLFSAWHAKWHFANVGASAAPSETRRAAPGNNVGMFFSGGVDSFYSLQKHRPEVTHLIFVTGFDIRVRQVEVAKLVVTELRRAVERIGLPLIEVETNLRELSEGFGLSWEQQHGAAIAAVAYFLAPPFRKIYVPSTYALPFVHPYGSHPGVDHFWSLEHLDVVHDGAEATRFDKIGALSSWDLAIQSLRVCYDLRGGEYNCCRCHKCLWTMAFLRSHGALANARTFNRPLDLHALSEATLENAEERYRFIQALAALEQRGDDPELEAVVRKLLQRRPSARHAAARSLRRLRHSAETSLRRGLRQWREYTRSRSSSKSRGG
jgi:hypothetical protein